MQFNSKNFRADVPSPSEAWEIEMVTANVVCRSSVMIVIDADRCRPLDAVGTSATSEEVTRRLDMVGMWLGLPKIIHVSRSPAFSSSVFHEWAAKRRVLIDQDDNRRVSLRKLIIDDLGRFLHGMRRSTTRDLDRGLEVWRRNYEP